MNRLWRKPGPRYSLTCAGCGRPQNRRRGTVYALHNSSDQTFACRPRHDHVVVGKRKSGPVIRMRSYEAALKLYLASHTRCHLESTATLMQEGAGERPRNSSLRGARCTRSRMMQGRSSVSSNGRRFDCLQAGPAIDPAGGGVRNDAFGPVEAASTPYISVHAECQESSLQVWFLKALMLDSLTRDSIRT